MILILILVARIQAVYYDNSDHKRKPEWKLLNIFARYNLIILYQLLKLI